MYAAGAPDTWKRRPSSDSCGVGCARVKSDPQMRRIPVVIYTSSNAPQDVTRAYELQANCYLVKPPDLAGIERMFGLLDEFWLQTVRLPQR